MESKPFSNIHTCIAMPALCILEKQRVSPKRIPKLYMCMQDMTRYMFLSKLLPPLVIPSPSKRSCMSVVLPLATGWRLYCSCVVLFNNRSIRQTWWVHIISSIQWYYSGTVVSISSCVKAVALVTSTASQGVGIYIEMLMVIMTPINGFYPCQ